MFREYICHRLIYVKCSSDILVSPLKGYFYDGVYIFMMVYMGLIFLELASSYHSGLISSESLNQSNRPSTSMVLL
jgi:hypothetical protein